MLIALNYFLAILFACLTDIFKKRQNIIIESVCDCYNDDYYVFTHTHTLTVLIIMLDGATIVHGCAGSRLTGQGYDQCQWV